MPSPRGPAGGQPAGHRPVRSVPALKGTARYGAAVELWIYENWRAHGHRAAVHVSSCAHCNAGAGRGGGTDAANGRWHGPFLTGPSATDAAARTGAEIRRCGHCLPPG
jgi:hypothetical protein